MTNGAAAAAPRAVGTMPAAAALVEIGAAAAAAISAAAAIGGAAAATAAGGDSGEAGRPTSPASSKYDLPCAERTLAGGFGAGIPKAKSCVPARRPVSHSFRRFAAFAKVSRFYAPRFSSARSDHASRATRQG